MVKLPIEYKLDHIGVAVKNLREGELPYLAMGFSKSRIEEVPSEKVRVQMFELKNESRIELLEPTDENSIVAKFLAKRGPGIHHICLRVNDITAALARLKEHELKLIHEKPVPGAHGCQVAFIHPSSVGGVLVELSQKGRG